MLKILLLICVVEACVINSCSMVNLKNDIGVFKIDDIYILLNVSCITSTFRLDFDFF